MIVDSHAHFEPRVLDLHRVVAKMDRAGVDRVALIAPINPPLPGPTPERLLAVLRALMSSSLTRPLAELAHRATMTSGGVRVGSRILRVFAKPDNESVVAAVERYPSRFYGWIFLNPRAGGALDELERWRSEPGMIGVKLHPHWHDYPIAELDPILRRCEELRMPVLIHLGFRAGGDYRHIAERYPRLAVISAHAGFPFYKDLWAHRRDAPNLYVDLSSPYIDEELARGAVLAMGADRCLYGTDSPYGFHEEDGTYDWSEIRRWIDRMPLSSIERDRVYGDNFLAILAEGRGARP